MSLGNRKCPKCGLVTWADSEECPNCRSLTSKKSRGFWFRIRIYVLIGLGCITIFGVYWYVHRPQPPTDPELRFAFQHIVEANTTRTGKISHSPDQDGNFQAQLIEGPETRLESYQLHDAEMYETNDGTHYAAKFSLSCGTLDNSRSRVIKGLIKLKLVDEKWITEFVALAD